MPSETGTVAAVKQREKTYSIAVNKQWFGGFGKCSVEKGDKVRIDYKENGKYKNIKSIEKEETQPKVESVQRSDPVVDDIHLQVCLKAAAQVFTGTKATAQEIAMYSKELLKEIWGDK
jgi:hypothetical protein